jgi:4-oxalocrotonate tautomerase
MPHVIVKLWPGKTEAQKAELAEAIAQDVIKCLGSREASVSVSFEEVAQEEWAEKVVGPDIKAKPENLYKKPGYPI